MHMLEAPGFLRTYLSGGDHPEAVMAFGRTHGILINRVACRGG
ncbi:MAG TPA: hypothetical protein VLT88_16215 [Desulfosarcina sp.]|nr:hypothetical protein [Desulfosarcina sp.]